MASILALAKKLRAEAAKTLTTEQSPIGTVTELQLYPQLRYGEVEGIGTVEIDATANVVGHSPSERCTFKGETTWLPTEMVLNRRFNPFPMLAVPAKTPKE